MTQIRFKFQCGCIHADPRKFTTRRGSARRYCPEHPTKPATHKVFVCAHCGEDVLKPLQAGGPSLKYHPECQRIAWDMRRKERTKRDTEAGNWRRLKKGGTEHTTQDEINCLRLWRKDRVQKYMQNMGIRADWGAIDPVAVKQACREMLGGC